MVANVKNSQNFKLLFVNSGEINRGFICLATQQDCVHPFKSKSVLPSLYLSIKCYLLVLLQGIFLEITALLIS